MTCDRMATASAWSERIGSKALRNPIGVLSLCFASSFLTPVAGIAGDLPTGANVVSGNVSIATPGSQAMNITQGGDRAVVNWNSFSIGRNASVDINQPSASSAMLNRVTGSTTSSIHGQLNSNGQVFLVNPNGVFIGPNGAVNTSGFVASTLGISNGDFERGALRFTGDGSSGSVTNQGVINSVRGGYAALIGGQVHNSGIIRVPMGKVGLGAGERITLDLAGDRFMQVALPSDSDDEALEALVTNSGLIQASGGRVEITAATARDAARQAINMSGVIEAQSVGGRSGAIVLGGGPGGVVRVSGEMDVASVALVENSPRPIARSQRGGDITVTGSDVVLIGATLDVSGQSDGGTIRVGGDYQGSGNLPRALTTFVDAATRVYADGGDSGHGGRVIFWSDGQTDFSGQVSARGGEHGGDGGFVEVSGKSDLRYRGLADTRAPMGRTGQLLLDPGVIDVNAPEATVINGNLAVTNVELDTVVDGIGPGPGDININSDITWVTANEFRLTAENDINLNALITGTSGDFVLNAGGTISSTVFGSIDVGLFHLEAGAVNVDFLFSPVATDIVVDVPVSWSGFTGLSLTASNDITLNDAVTAPDGALSLSAGGDVITTSDTTIDVRSFFLSSGSWSQVGSLPSFAATDFDFDPMGATFVRALGGDGGSSPYQLTDAYGVQGVASLSLSNMNFVLANDIDASGTSGWDDFGEGVGGFRPIESFGGTFDGAGHTISDLFSDRFPGGLFETLTSSAVVTDLRLFNADVGGGDGGLLAQSNAGAIINTSVDGIFEGFGSGPMGGMVGSNTGTITDSFSSGTVSPDVFGSGTVNLGGLAGENSGTITRSHSAATVGATDFSGLPLVAGGLVGNNSGTIVDSYALSSLSLTDPASVSQSLGGLVGNNTGGTVTNSFAASDMTGNGTETIGGLIGTGPGTVNQSFWDTDVAGTVSAGGTGLTTAQLQDTDGFVATADPVVWDFANVWAAGEAGFYPANFSTSPVVFLQPDDFDVQYGLTGSASTTGTVGGGATAYVFGPSGDTLDTSGLLSMLTFSDQNVGTDILFGIETTMMTSTVGQDYRVVSTTGLANITAAPLTITPDAQSKTYGDLFVFDGSEFTLTGSLYFTDQITSVDMLSLGTPVDAQVAGSPYDITISNVNGNGLGNYSITNGQGTMGVDAAPLTITALDQSKLQGEQFTFEGTEFSVAGLVPSVPSDSVDSATLFSLGADAGATVSGSPYPIDVSDAVGSGLVNYTITYQQGLMVVGGDIIPPPPPPVVAGVPNPTDAIVGDGGDSGVLQIKTSSRVEQAQETLNIVKNASSALEIAAASCGQDGDDVSRYLACLADALDAYSKDLDALAADLPEGLESVGDIIQGAKAEILVAKAIAESRLASATTAAEREAIRKDAIGQAQASLNNASSEIRKAISLIRAEDPELVSLQTETVNTIVSAVDNVSIGLSRVVEL